MEHVTSGRTMTNVLGDTPYVHCVLEVASTRHSFLRSLARATQERHVGVSRRHME